MLEAKYIWNPTKISMLQQKFENFCKIWVVDAGYLWFNSFNFVTVNSTFETAFLCFLVITLSTVALFVLDKMFNCSNSLS